MIKYVLEELKVTPDQTDSNGNTPLHFAISSDAVNLLSAHPSADIKALNFKGGKSFKPRPLLLVPVMSLADPVT